MIKLSDQIKKMKMCEFRYVDLVKKVTKNQEDDSLVQLITFELEEPIERVTGSGYVYNPGTDEKISIYKTDVTHVTCKLELIEKYEDHFIPDEDSEGNGLRSGKYSGDMFLDVASYSEDVWLVDDKLANYGKTKRREEQLQRFNRYAKK